MRLEMEVKNAGQQLIEVEELKQVEEIRRKEVTSEIKREKEATFDREKEFNDLTKQYELEKE